MEYINLVEIQDFLNRDTNDFNHKFCDQIFNELHNTKIPIESIFLFLSRHSLETSLKEVNIKVSEFDKLIKELIELIESKKSELNDLQQLFENFYKKKRDIMKKIDCIKKEEQILKEIKITPSSEKMEDNSPAIQQGV